MFSSCKATSQASSAIVCRGNWFSGGRCGTATAKSESLAENVKISVAVHLTVEIP